MNLDLSVLSAFLRWLLGKHDLINFDVVDQSQPFLMLTNHREFYGFLLSTVIIPLEMSPAVEMNLLDINLSKKHSRLALREAKLPEWLIKSIITFVIPTLTRLLLKLGSIAVHRGEKAQGTIREIVAELQKGNNVCMAPESPKLNGLKNHQKTVCEFAYGPARAAELYKKTTGKDLNIYLGLGCPEEGNVRFAGPFHWDSTALDSEAEKKRMTKELYLEMKKLEADNQQDIKRGIVQTRKNWFQKIADKIT